MTADQFPCLPNAVAAGVQDQFLQRVSRTFALTIPQLPPGLREAVANAYLLCRIADTIEDDPALSVEQKEQFQEEFAVLVDSGGDAADFAARLRPLLSSATTPDEHDLIRNAALVLRITAALSTPRRTAIARCLRIMCRGMHRFQHEADRTGVRDLAAMDRYCYFVAGVVGEMLTDLFCEHSPWIARDRERMMRLAVSFGQGLQMTNILKDVWEDLARGACWLPRDVFARHGFDLAHLKPGCVDPAFHAAYRELLGVAHAHLRDALAYMQAMPPHETGIRRFCAWAIGMAVLTLDKINDNLSFACGADVKITRGAVARTVFLTRIGVRSNAWLGWLFNVAAGNLPRAQLALNWDGFVAPCVADLGESPA
jgi:farnesyl-diphosphate farnesyltransferase